VGRYRRAVCAYAAGAGSGPAAALLGGEDRGRELVFADRDSVLAFASLAFEIDTVEPTSLAGRDAVDTALDFTELVAARPVKRCASLYACCGFWGSSTQGSSRLFVQIVTLQPFVTNETTSSWVTDSGLEYEVRQYH
jgi:hypothetical protein